ncbi:hypothetical protein AWC38_SpisGene20647 [Stylophora pistillata]|uniref:DH domain-containing protein n=1 Tax=Stylophora pistillata TaxID=50429 RepID=A0A2B4RFU5_STYPI|nr:hypothetical protein AWC38_SpisGene20647 [Stylophora pistillata]
MENNTSASWTVIPERSVGHPVSGFSLAVLEKIAEILDCSQEAVQDTQNLQRNLESLIEEKEHWRNFMDMDEWNRAAVDEVETAWKKRSQGDQSTELLSLENLPDGGTLEPEKPHPHTRPLRRSHTDPTDLLWVFRRRASLLAQRVHQDLASSGNTNECNEPFRDESVEENCKTEQGFNKTFPGKTQYSRSVSSSSQGKHPKEPVGNEERSRESSSDSESRDTAYEWTAMPMKHLPRRKISAPAYRPGRSQVAMPANRRASVAVAPRRINRRGSEAPALTVIARRRNSQVAYPVGLRRKSRATSADNQLSIQAKAKHELLANLVLPACVDQPPRTRERRNTFTFQAPSMRTKKDEKRYQVAKEILETEKKYLSCLRTLKEVFEEPMRESNLMSSKEIDASGGETSYERETYEEMAAIEEEAIEDLKDNKNQGQNVFRMAADSLIRNWQRRSRKWRRSTEEPFKSESLSENDGRAKENETNENENKHYALAEGQNEDENANVSLDDKDVRVSGTPPCTPFRKNAVVSRARPRPVSLGYLSTNDQLKEHQQRIKGKVLSDPSLAKDDDSLECTGDVWIPRSQTLSSKRRPSDNFGRSVCSSVVSGDSSPSTGSKKSLSRISQESLADSGLSETPGSSPSNTLNNRTQKFLKEKRDKLSSSSLTNVSVTNEPKRKLSQLNRRSWGDWVSAEMENTQDEVSVERDDQVDDVSVKNKRRFKDVMKQFFSSKKK